MRDAIHLESNRCIVAPVAHVAAIAAPAQQPTLIPVVVPAAAAPQPAVISTAPILPPLPSVAPNSTTSTTTTTAGTPNDESDTSLTNIDMPDTPDHDVWGPSSA
jgi:hypothetical protein